MYTKTLQTVGDSKAVILDVALRREYGITDTVDIERKPDGILIRKPHKKPREGWDEAIAKMDMSKEEISIPDVFEDEDLSWWVW